MPRPLALMIVTALAAVALARPDPGRSYSAGSYRIEIDGMPAAVATSVQGGNIVAEVAEERGGEKFARKRVGRIRIEPIRIEVSAGELIDLIKKGCDGTGQMFNGRVVEVDTTGSVIGEREFTNAVLTEIQFPQLDAASKEAARVLVTLQPEQIKSGGGKSSGSKEASAKQRQAQASNFRVKVGELDGSGVSKVEAISIRMKSPETPDSRSRSTSSGQSVGDLVLTVSSAKSKPFADWHEEFVVKGNNSQDREKTATIELMSADMKNALLTLEGSGVGIIAVRPESGGSDSAKRVQVQMYVEQWRVK
jgi:hypothetical protein